MPILLLHLQPSLGFRNPVHPVPATKTPTRASSHLSSPTQNSTNFSKWATDFRSKSWNFALSGALSLALSLTGVGFAEGKVGVNKPELLPKEFRTVIDVAGFLSDGQEKRLAREIDDIEKDTGFKLRVLAQNYPNTPGLAVKDFWQVDDRTIVFVADPTFGNIINFNVGNTVDLDIPRSFWSRLAGKYGNIFYWKEKGEDASIEAAVMAISNCLREPVGRNNCSENYLVALQKKQKRKSSLKKQNYLVGSKKEKEEKEKQNYLAGICADYRKETYASYEHSLGYMLSQVVHAYCVA